MVPFEECFSKIMDEFTSAAYSQELQKAKKEFFDAIGPVHEEDSFFETYMTAYVEWYLFDRDLSNQDLPPIKLYYRNHLKDFSDEEQKIFNDFLKFRHSLFLVKKVSSSEVQLQDLYDNEKIKISSQVPTAAFTAGEIFEAILVPYKGEWTFTKTFFIHPQEAKKFITKQMKTIKNLEHKIVHRVLMKFRKLRLKLDRYPYVTPTQIYNEEEFSKHA